MAGKRKRYHAAFYAPATGERRLNLARRRRIDAQFLDTPWYGSRQRARHLRRQGHGVGRKRVRRLRAKMTEDDPGDTP